MIYFDLSVGQLLTKIYNFCIFFSFLSWSSNPRKRLERCPRWELSRRHCWPTRGSLRRIWTPLRYTYIFKWFLFNQNKIYLPFWILLKKSLITSLSRYHVKQILRINVRSIYFAFTLVSDRCKKIRIKSATPIIECFVSSIR